MLHSFKYCGAVAKGFETLVLLLIWFFEPVHTKTPFIFKLLWSFSWSQVLFKATSCHQNLLIRIHIVSILWQIGLKNPRNLVL